MARSGRNEALYFPLLFLLTVFTIFIIQVIIQQPERNLLEAPRGGDVAVLGGSTAAILSAVEASKHGAEVYLFPLEQELGEDAPFLVKEGLAAAGTPIQEASGLEITPSMLRSRIEKHGQGLSVRDLLDALEDAAPGLPAEAAEAGEVEFNYLPLPEENPYLHYAASPSSSAYAFRDSLLGKLQDSPVFINNREVEEILLAPEGKVEALLLENENGEKEHFYVRSVVLATGGYSAELDRWHDLHEEENKAPLRPGQEGKGLLLAESLGVEIIQEGFYNTRPVVCPLQEREETRESEETAGCSMLLHAAFGQPGIYVYGEEGFIPLAELGNSEELLEFISSSSGAYLVAEDGAPGEIAGDEGFWQEFNDMEELLEFLEAPGVEGLPAEPDLPLNVAFLREAVAYTMGGLPVTSRGEVKKEGGTLEGLYASGEITGGLHGAALLTGMPLSETLFMSRAAGREAAGYAIR